MKKISKRFLSVLMAVVMVVTILPSFVIPVSANMIWTAVASSDFSKATNVSNGSAMYTPTYNGLGNEITWTNVIYNQNGSIEKEDDAVYIPDGYMYMSGYGDNSGTPVKNLSAFKIDFAFRYKDVTIDNKHATDHVTSDGTYTFLKLGAYGNFGNYNADMFGYTTFTQDANGKTYSYDTTLTTGSENTRVATSSNYIECGVNYHYILEYTGKSARAYVTDDNGVVVEEILNTTNATHLSEIQKGLAVCNYMKIGDSKNTNYIRALEYRNITFYKGEELTDNKNYSTSQNKYLYTYFVGNSDEGENLRYAVSDDGINFYTLNKGFPVTEVTVPESGEGLEVYPTGTTTSAYSTGNVRDPYVLRATDGKYYIIATDLNTSVHGFSNNSKFLVWHLDKLTDINTTTPWVIDITGMMQSVDSDVTWVNRAWAPQAIYDTVKDKYMLYFAARTQSSGTQSGTVMYYVYTDDFKSFDSEPKRLINTLKDNIDGDITYNESDNLYYLWYKNENDATIAYATATTPSGPYTNSTKFSESEGKALEGPQVYTLTDGYSTDSSYVLLADAYASGEMQLYQANSVTGFSAKDTSSNIDYLHSRHGSVTRITEAEYNALIEKFGTVDRTYTNGIHNKIEFYFTSTDDSIKAWDDDDNRSYDQTGWIGSTKDPGGAKYQVAAGGYVNKSTTSSYSASNGVLSLKDRNIFIVDDPVRDLLKTRNFKITFKHTVTDASKINSTVPIVAIGNKIDGDYISLTEDGTFKVGGNTIKLEKDFTNVVGTEHEYTISLTKSTTTESAATAILLIDGTYMGSYVLNGEIDSNGSNPLYAAFGWSDASEEIAANKTTGTYSELVFTNSPLNPEDYKVSCTSLSEAISLFESRVKDMADNGYESLYTNISPAYECYKEAKAATTEDTELLSRFNDALNNMLPFVEYTAQAIPSGDNFNPEGYYYSNVIFSEGGTDGEHKFSENSKAVLYKSTNSWWEYGTHAYIYYPNTVLLYDGKTTPKVPVMAGFLNADYRYSLNMLYLNESIDDFSLTNSWWLGGTGSGLETPKTNDYTSFTWPNVNEESIPTNVNNTSENNNAETVNANDYSESDVRTTYRIHKNALSFDIEPTVAYSCYSSTTWNMRGQYTYLTANKQIDATIVNADADIDIINYKMLIDALKEATNKELHKGYLSDMPNKYTEGGLEGLFNALDSATALDPSSGDTYFDHVYDYANAQIDEAMDKAALLCGEDIDSSCSLLSDIKLTSSTVAIKQLKIAVADYEELMANMKNGALYTKLQPAYDAYLVAVEYIDAYEYGGKQEFEDPDAATVLSELQKAVSDMKTWTGTYDVNPSPKAFADDTANISYADPYYSSLAWVENTTSRSASLGDNGYLDSDYTRVNIYLPNAVAIYDGSTPIKVGSMTSYYIPGFRAGSKRTRMLYALWSDTSGLSYDSCWKSNNGTQAGNLNFTSVMSNPYDQFYGNNGKDKTDKMSNTLSNSYDTIHKSDSAKYYYANSLTVTPPTNDSGFSTSYYYQYKTLKVDYTYYQQYGSDVQNQQASVKDKTNYNGQPSNNISIYVINYAPLKSKLDTVASQFTNGVDVTKYKEGGMTGKGNEGLSTLFGYIDKLTAVDPTAYSFGSDTATAVSNCATDIKNAVNATASMDTNLSDYAVDTVTNGDVTDSEGNLQPISDSNGAYTNLKIAIKEAEQAPTKKGCILDNYWDSYDTALTAAKQLMSDMASKSGYSDNTYTETAINEYANNLHNSIEDLAKATSSAHALKFSYQENGTYNMYFQCYSNNAHIVDHEHDSTVIAANEDIGQNYNTLGYIYSTLDMSKFSEGGKLKIGDGYASYNGVKTEPHSTVDMIALSEQEKVNKIVDQGIADLLNAINTASSGEDGIEVPSFTIYYNVYSIDNSGTETKVYTSTSETRTYGNVFTVDITAADATAAQAALGMDGDEINVSSVGIERNGGTEARYMNTSGSNSVSVLVDNNLVVNLYVKQPIKTDKQVVLRDISGNDYFTIGVTADTKISYDKNEAPNSITIGGVKYTVPNTINYTITGWTLFGGYYDVGDKLDNVTVEELIAQSHDANLIFRPQKTLNPAKSDKYTFTLDGETIVENVGYDYRLRVTTEVENAFAIAVYDNGEFIPVAYKANDSDTSITYRLLANRSLDFYTICYSDGEYTVEYEGAAKTITNKTTLFYYDNKLPMICSYVDPIGDTIGTKSYYTEEVTYSNNWSTRSSFTTNVGYPEGSGKEITNLVITECGTLWTVNGAYNDEKLLAVENVDGSDVRIKVNSKRDAESNQYSCSINSSSSNAIAYTRAYVKYQYTFRGKTIDAVAYGPICTSFYGATPITN